VEKRGETKTEKSVRKGGTTRGGEKREKLGGNTKGN